MMAATDEEAARAVAVAEKLVHALASEPDTPLAAAALAMAVAWLATTRASTQREALAQIAAVSNTAREQTIDLFESSSDLSFLMQETLN